ncbi:MAG: hypothetical protein AB7P76_01720 [Candidatus Melainabacteria bacterium]
MSVQSARTFISRFSPVRIINRSGRYVLREMLNRDVLGRSYAQSQAAKFSIDIQPLVLGLTLGGAVLYRMGQGTHDPNATRRGDLLQFLRAGVIYLLADNTKHILPLAAAGEGMYQAGKQQDGLSKLQAFTNSLVTVGLGYLGVSIGQTFSEISRDAEERTLLRFLDQEKTPAKAFLQRIKTHPANTDGQKLHQAMDNLREHLTTLQEQIIGKDTVMVEGELLSERKATALFRKHLDPIRAEVLEGLNADSVKAMMNHLSRDEQQAIRNLRQMLSRSGQGYIRFVRAANPIFLSIILGSMVGIPVAYFINQQLARLFPGLRAKQPDRLLTTTQPLPTLPRTASTPGNPPPSAPATSPPPVSLGASSLPLRKQSANPAIRSLQQSLGINTLGLDQVDPTKALPTA